MKQLIITGTALLAIYAGYRCYYSLNLDGELERRLRQGALILDVRTPPEWERGHIPGSMNIALSKPHKGPIPIDTGTVIVTCCSHGLRSVRAATILRERGYRHAYNGGAWSDLGELLLRIQQQ